MNACTNCGTPRTGEHKIWCPTCGLAWDIDEAREVLGSLKVQGFTGRHSLSPKMTEFWATGDPEVFAKP